MRWSPPPRASKVGSDHLGVMSSGGLILLGLAPLAVVPARQGQGIGALLVHDGLARCRTLDAAAVVVLGHPKYYPRFGFVPAVTASLRHEYDAREPLEIAWR